MPSPIETDALVIGAGPIGLFQAFQLGLQDIRCHIVDALPHVGGQCVELYADKPIYDIPGLPFCTGRELIERLQQQVKPFAPSLHLAQRVTTLSPQADGRLHLITAKGTEFLARTVFIAAGVGAFEPRRLALEGADTLEGHGLHYQLDHPEALTAHNVCVVGGDELAVHAALRLVQAGAHVTLMHRRDVFQAPDADLQAMRAAVAQGQLQLRIGQLTALHRTDDHLSGIEVATPDGETVTCPMQHVVALLGLSPKLGPLTHWGLEMARKQLVVNTETFTTSIPGIFAVGDINTYPGKKKLILCGFHEATLAAFGAATIVHPERKTLLQYTTTSTELHRLLGVA